MTGDRSLFLTLTMKEGGTVGFGASINNMWLVDGLNHNLLSISQFCDNGYDVLFVNTACYVQNRIYIRLLLNKTAYELFKGRKPNISYFHQFGCTCYVLNNKVYLKKFDAKA